MLCVLPVSCPAGKALTLAAGPVTTGAACAVARLATVFAVLTKGTH